MHSKEIETKYHLKSMSEISKEDEFLKNCEILCSKKSKFKPIKNCKSKFRRIKSPEVALKNYHKTITTEFGDRNIKTPCNKMSKDCTCIMVYYRDKHN